MYCSGLGAVEISYRIGCSKSTVRRWMLDFDRSGDENFKYRKAPSPSSETMRLAVREYASDRKSSIYSLAKKYRVHYSSLSRWITRAGVTVRSRPVMFDEESILNDLKSGIPRGDIAQKHGCSLSWVYRVQSGY